jgi:hypothetical protein
MQSCETRDDLTEDMECVGGVPASQLIARRGQAGAAAKALQQVVVWDGEIIVPDFIEQPARPARIETYSLVVERLKPTFALELDWRAVLCLHTQRIR